MGAGKETGGRHRHHAAQERNGPDQGRDPVRRERTNEIAHEIGGAEIAGLRWREPALRNERGNERRVAKA